MIEPAPAVGDAIADIVVAPVSVIVNAVQSFTVLPAVVKVIVPDTPVYAQTTFCVAPLFLNSVALATVPTVVLPFMVVVLEVFPIDTALAVLVPKLSCEALMVSNKGAVKLVLARPVRVMRKLPV